MNDMRATIIPKLDQISADDLIAGPMTITITQVSIRPGTEQPVTVGYADDNGRPWRPCKSMCRVLVAAWGADANKYVGRSLTLYRDSAVKWGGMEVGGIRVSHMSDIASQMVLALTATKGNKKPFTVKPLAVDAPKVEAPKPGSVRAVIAEITPLLERAATLNAVAAVEARDDVARIIAKGSDAQRAALHDLIHAHRARLGGVAATEDDLVGDAQEPGSEGAA